MLETDERLERFTRLVRCEVCGSTGKFEFAAPVGAYDVEEAGPGSLEVGPRRHHYAFAHNILHQLFFDDPDGVLAVLNGPAGLRRLKDLWTKVGEDFCEDEGSRLSASDIVLTKADLHGRLGVVLRLPTAVAPPEAYFVALVATASGDTARYFVLERTEEVLDGLTSPHGESLNTEPRAVLCEWVIGEKRRNHERVIVPNEAAFVQEVLAQLEEEERRVKASARRVAAPAWDPVADREPGGLFFDAEAGFRCQPCLFAFHALPDAVFGAARAWGSLANSGSLTEVVDDLWGHAAEACLRLDELALPSTEKPSIEFVELDCGPHVLVRMPEALSAPEPLFIAIPRKDAKEIYLAEAVGIRARKALFATISTGGIHAVIHDLAGTDLNHFLNAVVARATGSHSVPDTTSDILQHLASYPVVAEKAKQAGLGSD